MRILIADDNAALQGILREVISDAGHTVETASSVEGALASIGSFRPDAIFLDADMVRGKGMGLLDEMQNSTPPIDIPVMIIRSWNRQIPQDSAVVRGHIDKPFTSLQILESIGLLQAGEAAVTTNQNGKQTDPGQKTLRSALADKKVMFGRSYVIFRSDPDAVHELLRSFEKDVCDVLIVTTGKSKTMLERFGKNNIKTLPMKIKLFGGHFNIYGLGTMIDNIDEFIRENRRPVVAFDDLNKIIERNGINSVLTAIHQIVTKKYNKDLTFLVSVDPKGFTVKDKEILLNHMILHDPTGE